MSAPPSQLRAHTDGIVVAPYKLFNPVADDNADALSAAIWLKAMFLQWWKGGAAMEVRKYSWRWQFVVALIRTAQPATSQEQWRQLGKP